MAPAPVSVAQFLAASDHPRVDEVARLRDAILAIDPAVTERIKWNAPSFGLGNSDRVTFRLQPGDRVELVLHRGAATRTDPFAFADPHGLVVWRSADRGTITLSPDSDHDVVVDTVAAWLAATRD